MTFETAILATLPPACAIFIERFNPLTEKYIQPKVKLDLSRFNSVSNYKTLEEISTKVVCGAVEVAGLAPTFFAVLTSGLGILFEHPSPWFFVIYILALALFVGLTFHFLGGQTFYQVEATQQPWKIGTRTINFGRTGSEVIGRFIVRLNILLILIIWTIYLVFDPPLEEFAKIEHHVLNLLLALWDRLSALWK
jgi:hypothetical protein